MSQNADEPNLIDRLGAFQRTTAQGVSTLWGLMLDHLSDQHAKAVAARTQDQPGGVGRTPDGILVTSKELLLQVLLNRDGHYTNAGYQARMSESIGPIYLGMDWGPEYESLSTRANAAIGRVTRREAFEQALKETRTALAALPDAAAFDIQQISDVVLAALCTHWFDIPDGEFVKAGGFRLSNLVAPGRCPGDFTPPSAYIFHPDPDALLTLIGQRTGQILRESVGKYVASRRATGNPPVGLLARAFFEIFPDSPGQDDLLARTIVGAMMGALPTINGNLVNIVKTWQKAATLLVLRAKLRNSAEADEFARAQAIVEQPMQETMQMAPTPDAIWRTAAKDHTLGTSHPVQVQTGDKICLNILKATQGDLLAGVTDVSPVFGGDRQQSPCPMHACPGFEMGYGILLGIVYGVVEWQPR